jgi:hypothetical protein
MSRAILIALLACSASACTERALGIPEDGGLFDLSAFDRNPDLFDLGRDLGPDLSMFDMPPPNPCPAGTNFIFTIDSDTTLSRFNPVSNQFFDVGAISCPTVFGGTPNSMAIDRQGNGWLNYSSGELFRLITAQNACSPTGYQPGQGGFTNFGMSFAQDTPGGPQETLYVADTSNGGPTKFGTIDLMSFQLENLIDIPGGTMPELTGDDEAGLWGFFPADSPPKIARIDKQTGTLDEVISLPQLSGNPQAWGVAHYQGDFYVFLQRNNDPSTRIYRINRTTHAFSVVVSNTGRRIVGVGVATCAGNGLE